MREDVVSKAPPGLFLLYSELSALPFLNCHCSEHGYSEEESILMENRCDFIFFCLSRFFFFVDVLEIVRAMGLVKHGYLDQLSILVNFGKNNVHTNLHIRHGM